jgi:hypothetical protein
MTTRKNSAGESDSNWTILYCSTMEEVQSAIESKDFVFPQIKRAIYRMLRESRTSDMCTEIWCIDTLSSIWISITLEEAPKSLEKMLAWYLDREEFEECAEVQKLITQCRERLANAPDESKGRTRRQEN